MTKLSYGFSGRYSAVFASISTRTTLNGCAPLLYLLNFKSFLRPFCWAMPVSRIFLLFSETAFLKRIWTGSGKKVWAPKRLLKFSVKCHTSFHELVENLCNEDVISQNKTENICNLLVHICHLKNQWYFVSKIVQNNFRNKLLRKNSFDLENILQNSMLKAKNFHKNWDTYIEQFDKRKVRTIFESEYFCY